MAGRGYGLAVFLATLAASAPAHAGITESASGGGGTAAAAEWVGDFGSGVYDVYAEGKLTADAVGTGTIEVWRADCLDGALTVTEYKTDDIVFQTTPLVSAQVDSAGSFDAHEWSFPSCDYDGDPPWDAAVQSTRDGVPLAVSVSLAGTDSPVRYHDGGVGQSFVGACASEHDGFRRSATQELSISGLDGFDPNRLRPLSALMIAGAGADVYANMDQCGPAGAPSAQRRSAAVVLPKVRGRKHRAASPRRARRR